VRKHRDCCRILLTACRAPTRLGHPNRSTSSRLPSRATAACPFPIPGCSVGHMTNCTRRPHGACSLAAAAPWGRHRTEPETERHRPHGACNLATPSLALYGDDPTTRQRRGCSHHGVAVGSFGHWGGGDPQLRRLGKEDALGSVGKNARCVWQHGVACPPTEPRALPVPRAQPQPLHSPSPWPDGGGPCPIFKCRRNRGWPPYAHSRVATRPHSIRARGDPMVRVLATLLSRRRVVTIQAAAQPRLPPHKLPRARTECCLQHVAPAATSGPLPLYTHTFPPPAHTLVFGHLLVPRLPV
jgi:hypothetical protein